MWNLHKIPVISVNDIFQKISSKLIINHLKWYENANCILYISLNIHLQAYKSTLTLSNWIFIKLDLTNTNKLYWAKS